VYLRDNKTGASQQARNERRIILLVLFFHRFGPKKVISWFQAFAFKCAACTALQHGGALQVESS
jgi:hypothetical protein